jgi:glycosyltransferase involved in cell wall biosynthesis
MNTQTDKVPPRDIAVKILVLTNLYPPHHAGTYDCRCQIVCEELRALGHEIHLLTSNYGTKSGQSMPGIDRQLILNGQFGVPKASGFMELKELEAANNRALRDAIEAFKPQVVFVWSLLGLSKSLIFSLEQTGLPIAYDVADDWLVSELRVDPWLNFWNCEKLPFKEAALRKSLEMSGQRDAWDEKMPTRFDKSVKRMPSLFTGSGPAPEIEPDTIRTFPFKRIYFCSLAMKERAVQSGYSVNHADVIQPLIQTELFKGEVKPESAPANKLLVFRNLVEGCGAITALESFAKVRQTNPDAHLDFYGLGDSQYIARLKSMAVQEKLSINVAAINDPLRELPTIFPKYDVYLHTAERQEPLSIAPLEAMACGLPVIGTQMGGVGSFLVNEDNALTYVAGDAANLTEKIQIVQAYPDFRHKMALRGQQRVVDGHNINAVMNWIEAYLVDTHAYWSQL